MSLGLKHQFDQGMHFFSGTVDEHAEFDFLLADPAPLIKINLRHVVAMNSLGIRKLVLFAKAAGDRPIEYHEIPSVFIEAVNIMPVIIGGQKYISRIRSVRVPMNCEGRHRTEVSMAISHVYRDKEFVTPVVDCKICKMPLTLELETDLEDFFFFLTLGS